MGARQHDAILLDLDGTLLDDAGCVRPRVAEALHAADAAGVRVMIATGRSTEGTRPVLDELGVGAPAVVYNGAGLYCRATDRLLEERVLSNRTVARSFEYARRTGLMTMAQRAGEKFVREPRNDRERSAVRMLEGLQFLPLDEIPTEYLIRITFFGTGLGKSAELAAEVAAFIDQPLHMTNFDLASLADHRGSDFSIVDVQPPCRGKAEGVRWLWEEQGIPPERVVAVGDALNDLEMVRSAGVGVAMGNAHPALKEQADRVIGQNGTDAIAELVGELFL